MMRLRTGIPKELLTHSISYVLLHNEPYQFRLTKLANLAGEDLKEVLGCAASLIDLARNGNTSKFILTYETFKLTESFSTIAAAISLKMRGDGWWAVRTDEMKTHEPIQADRSVCSKAVARACPQPT